MSLTASMWTGVSGLLSHGEKMNVIGNNIANVNTVGFKSQRMDFMDFVYQNRYVNSGIGQIGRGVKIGAIMQNFETGAFETSTEATDLAISGSGFFKVNKIGSDQAYYTRAGNFRFNTDGYLVDPNGLAVQGWRVDNNGGVTQAAGGLNPNSVKKEHTSDIIGSGVPTDVKLDTWSVVPQQTTKITFKVQLPSDGSDNSRDSTNPFASLLNAWDGSQPPASPTTEPISKDAFAHQTTIEVYDEGGSKHKITIYYDKIDPLDYDGGNPNSDNMWEYMVTMAPEDDQRMYYDAASGELKNVNSTPMGGVLMVGTMSFDAAGRLKNQSSYTWGGSQSPVSNPGSYTEVADPTDPMNVVNVINLDPTNLNNWQPAAISSNGYPLLVANFSGILDAQTAGSPNGEKYNIEMDFGMKIGNFSAPWENRNSLGSLAVPAYASNPSYQSGRPELGPQFLAINPGYDPTITDWTDPNAYQYKFNGVAYDNAGAVAGQAGSPAMLTALHQLYGDVTLPIGSLGEIPDSTGGTMPLPPVNVTVDFSTGNTQITSPAQPTAPYADEAERKLAEAWGFVDGLALVVAPGIGNPTTLKDAIGEQLATQVYANRGVFQSAQASNLINVAEMNKPVIIDANACTSYDASFASNQAQNGYGYGDLSSWSVDADGILYGVYSNGVQLPLWQLTMYDFNCSQGLRREGNNLFSQTRQSGEPKSGAAGSAGLGTINGYSLEQSNVDLSTEFVLMITTQRGFQGNSKVVTTTDTMLETVINMKR